MFFNLAVAVINSTTAGRSESSNLKSLAFPSGCLLAGMNEIVFFKSAVTASSEAFVSTNAAILWAFEIALLSESVASLRSLILLLSLMDSFVWSAYIVPKTCCNAWLTACFNLSSSSKKGSGCPLTCASALVIGCPNTPFLDELFFSASDAIFSKLVVTS